MIPSAPSAATRSLRGSSEADPDTWFAHVASLPVTEQVGLVRNDQYACWQRGQRVLIEHYLGRLPALQADADALVDLLYGEVVLREGQGEKPSLEEYVLRFPGFAAALERQFAVHALFASGTASSLPETVSPTVSAGGLARVENAATVAQTPSQRGAAAALSWAAAALVIGPDYELRGELGRGGMGIVYRAYDRRRQQLVALKTMQQLDADALRRFKDEFRALADVAHPNLVSLDQLYSDGRTWFFTMELVEGVDFLTHVRGGANRAEQEERLRQALVQLGEGLLALHDASKLHRDIKPSNVLVTAAGRVVLLDFGLVAELGPEGRHAAESSLLGTIAYMAPEQAAGQPTSPASDWYSVGVMLYQVLTGRLPFAGTAWQMIESKMRSDPAPPRALVPDVPADLDALCWELLQRDPHQRPPGREVLARLAGTTVSGVAPLHPPLRGTPLVGREHHLALLQDAYEQVRQGRTVTLHVHGRSGAGKSALLQRFLDGLAEQGEALVLAGRCYEQESVPYKALDTLMDALSRHLAGLPGLEVRQLLPDDLEALTRVFPVFGGLRGLAGATQPLAPVVDPQELRRRAFAALRQLLTRLGSRRPLVLAIDDLQWGDVDSVALLADVLRPPNSPVLLLLGCYRSENIVSSPFLRELLRPELLPAPLERRELAVEPLTSEEARDLAVTLLGRVDSATQLQAEAVAREAQGNPLFVGELVEHLQAGMELGACPAGEVTLDEVIRCRVERLPAGPRRLLAVVAVAGQPLRQREATEAAGLGAEDLSALALLRAARLLRATGRGDADRVEAYHDRIRETVVAHLPPPLLRDLHGHLARTLEAAGKADAEVLAYHLEGAGDALRAGEFYARAGEQAAAALAFDRAARLYRKALQLRPGTATERRHLQCRLAEALRNAGRGAEAAPIYLQAARGAGRTESLELRRRAAEQFLYSGRIDEGLSVMRSLLRPLGLWWPPTPSLALLSVLYHRLLVRLRGTRFRPRRPEMVTPGELLRLDVCWSMAMGLSHVDPIRGTDFQNQFLLLAGRAGEPSRFSRALSLEAGFSACGGGRSRAQTEQLLRRAAALAGQLRQPYTDALFLLASAIAAFLEGRWRAAGNFSDRCEQILRGQCTGVTGELNAARFYGIRALEFLGETGELARRLPALLQDAQDRGDLSAFTNLRTRVAYLWRLMADAPDLAQQELDWGMAQWSRDGFFLQHYFQLGAQLDLFHYRGEAKAAWEFLEQRWPSLVRSLVLRVQANRLTMWHLRGRSAVAAAAVLPAAQRPSLLQVAEDHAERIEREDMAWSNPLGELVRAGVAAVRGDREQALLRLTAAEAGFQAADMALYAAVTRRCRGQLLGGTSGSELVTAADAWMTQQGIHNPARWSAMYAPGLPD